MKSKNLARKLFAGSVVLEKLNSPVNGEITILEELFGEKRISIGGLTQSGRIIENIWDKGIKRLVEVRPEKVLLLGFGGGSAAWVVRRRFPKAKIKAVEIDPLILMLAKKYFRVKEIRNLSLVIADAAKWIKKSKEKFDLVLIDTYQGEKIPENCQTKEFFRSIKSLLSPRGIAIFNHLYSHQEKIQAENFRQRLFDVFPRLTSLTTLANILFKVSSEEA